ncbi:hypothetical protein [Acinetobacter sp. Ver3]|uniref:hypothetical protein n=1 Tax=Acinetobacter sp. Ver3 TaxID=466088 RepID=UPI0004451D94|nr:hypothetical protein [Acinetobacter sp. Ver3]EZQ11693.1 hypothetical protein CL42_03985 [Acinetobacter sp. Ver3]
MHLPPDDTQFFSDYYRSQIGEHYYLKEENGVWFVFNFQQWVPLPPPDQWILGYKKPLFEFTEWDYNPFNA